jgi:hypothetical protein
MPTISSFFGILIKMYFEEHNPPYFHAEYQGYEAVFSITTGELTETKKFPIRATKLIKEWAIEHHAELLENWKRMEQDQTLFKIPGADQ